MRRILVLFAHPSLDRSEVNRPLMQATAGVEGVTLVDLYAEYPDFQIDIDREQGRLLAHDVIVFMHPLYWYSTPAILKEWQDLVLDHVADWVRVLHALRNDRLDIEAASGLTRLNADLGAIITEG